LCLGFLALSGCAGVDRFSGRAFAYNQQAETIKEQEFLLNVMRAAYREPLQFSDFTQVTGQASVSGTAAFTLPISTFPSTLSKTFVASPSATLSGNQSFTIDNLNTQEFYEGILSPIPMSTIDYYMQADYPKAVVLTLVVQRIELRPEYGLGAPVAFENSYAGANYRRFEAVLQSAIDLGLTTETVDVMQPVGPPMTAAQLPDLKYLTALSTTGAKLKTYEFDGKNAKPPDPHLNAAQKIAFARQGVSEYYRLVSVAEKAHFCFAADGQDGAISLAAKAQANTVLTAAGVLHDGLTLDDIKIPPSAICGATDQAADASSAGQMVEFDVKSSSATAADRKYEIVISTRSVEGIMYYLGEWARAELHAAPGLPAALAPLVATGAGADSLFRIGQSCRQDLPNIVADYDGTTYCIAVDPSGQDRSAQVMEIVSQLFALNNSAKNLPSSSLISVLSP
jgi:hypothetical protein